MEAFDLKIEQYEGPLDLLLALITKHKIDIFDIPIAEIAQQYVDYLDAMRRMDMEVASEFIVMAAELMLIKSRMLLPRDEKDEDPRAPLVDALLEHKRALAAAEFLREQSVGHFDTFTKPADEPPKTDYSRGHAVELLAEAFMRIADRLAFRREETEPELFRRIEEHYYTVDEKISAIVSKLEQVGSCRFDELFVRVRSRSEAVAVFLALLESVRDGVIAVRRDGGGDVHLSLAEPDFDTQTGGDRDEYE